jgi:hypothetical protein
MLEHIKSATGKATCMLNGQLIPKDEAALSIGVSKVQSKQIGFDGLQKAIAEFSTRDHQDIESLKERWQTCWADVIDAGLTDLGKEDVLFGFLIGAGVGMDQIERIFLEALFTSKQAWDCV